MAIQKRLAQVGVKVQSGKGTLQSAPALVFGTTSGAITGAEVAEGDLNLTWPGRMMEGFERTELKPGVSFETVATPRLTNYLLSAALGSEVTTNPANGVMRSTLAANAAAGATSISIATPIAAGALANGQILKIDRFGGHLIEYRTITSFTGTGPWTVNFATPLTYAHASGVQVVSVPYTHTLTPADDLVYATLFGRLGSSYYRIGDAKIDEIELAFDKLAAVRLKAKALGCTIEPLASAWVADPDADERVANGYLGAAGQPFTVDGLTAAAVSGSVKLTNHVMPVMTGFQATPTDVMPGVLDAALSLRVIPDDLLLWRKVITGSTTGTAAVGVPYYGALNFKWAMSANEDLVVASPRAKLLTNFPDSGPEGGPVEIQVEARVGVALTGAGLTATLRGDG